MLDSRRSYIQTGSNEIIDEEMKHPTDSQNEVDSVTTKLIKLEDESHAKFQSEADQWKQL